MCHQPWPSLAFPSSKAALAFPAGAWDVCPYQSSSAGWTQSVELLVLCALPPPSPPRLLRSLETIFESWAAPSALGTDTPRVITVSCVCQPGWLSLLGQANLHQEPGSAWRCWGSVWIPIFIKPWGFLWGCGKQHLLLHWIPIQQQVFYFLPLPCKGRPPGPPGLWICSLCSYEVWGSSLNLWSLLTLPLIAPWQRFWVFTIIPSVLLRTSISQTPVQGSNVACSRSLGSASASFASDSDTWLQWNQCQPSHHCQ